MVDILSMHSFSGKTGKRNKYGTGSYHDINNKGIELPNASKSIMMINNKDNSLII